MPELSDVSFLIAFGGGLASFFSPCVLPLIPAYLGSLGMVAYPGRGGQVKKRSSSFWPALAFVAGFSLVFILMGLSLGVVGTCLSRQRLLLSRLGGGAVVIFGLSQWGLLKFSFFHRSWSPGRNLPLSTGTGKLFLMGVIFSLGWSPCIGPILAGILFMAIGTADYRQSLIYLISYSAGLALPFLLISFFMDSLSAKLRAFHRFQPWLGRLNGILLILLGAVLIFGKF